MGTIIKLTHLIDGILTGQVKETRVDLWLLYLQIWKSLATAVLALLCILTIIFAVFARYIAVGSARAYDNVMAWTGEVVRE